MIRSVSLDTLVHRSRPPAGEAEGALVLLHGRGTSEDDLFPLIEILDPETFLSTFKLAASWLEALPEDVGVPPERTVLGGFSQGSVMSYALGLGEGRPSPAGILALSGFLPSVPGFRLDLESRIGLPVASGHGTHDPVIGVEFGRAARRQLEEAGLAVTWRETPMGHSVDPRYLAELAGWMRRV